MKIFALLLSFFLISQAHAQNIESITPLFFIILYALAFIIFLVFLTFLARKGRKVSTFLLTLIIPQLLPSIFIYLVYFITPNLMKEGMFITVFIIPFIAMILTFIFLIKVKFLKELKWLRYFKKT